MKLSSSSEPYSSPPCVCGAEQPVAQHSLRWGQHSLGEDSYALREQRSVV